MVFVKFIVHLLKQRKKNFNNLYYNVILNIFNWLLKQY
jgi:hypothetical protein